MIIITQQRQNCIGCHYCIDAAPFRWTISEQDGKSDLIDGVNKKGFFTAKVPDLEWQENLNAANHCPMDIIKIKKI